MERAQKHVRQLFWTEENVQKKRKKQDSIPHPHQVSKTRGPNTPATGGFRGKELGGCRRAYARQQVALCLACSRPLRGHLVSRRASGFSRQTDESGVEAVGITHREATLEWCCRGDWSPRLLPGHRPEHGRWSLVRGPSECIYQYFLPFYGPILVHCGYVHTHFGDPFIC